MLTIDLPQGLTRATVTSALHTQVDRHLEHKN